MTPRLKVMTLMLPLAITLTSGLSACGNDAQNDTTPAATPSASEVPAQSTTQPVPSASSSTATAITDPAPPAFAVCRSCHSTQVGQNGIGPTLAGIYGSKAGEVKGFNFSPALAQSGITWDRQSLDTWLSGPMKMVPGTRMALPVSDPQKRAEIIDYLETLK